VDPHPFEPTPQDELTLADLALTKEKALFRSLFDFLDRSSDAGQLDRLIRFRKRLEKDVEYFVRDLLTQHQGGGGRLTDKERQLRVINKKAENYQRLNDRIREDNPGIEDAVAKRAAATTRATGERQRRRSRSSRGREKRS